MVAAKKKQLNMTEGPLFGKILLFVLPLMATNLLQTLYNAADMVVVGFSPEPDAVGAIGMTSAFINLVVNVFIGFATGANVMVARYLGARDADKASRTVHTSLVMSLIFGTLGAVIGLIVARPVLSMMGAEGKLLDLATYYTKIYFAAMPFLSVTNYLIAIFRAKGDTKTPLMVLSAAGLLNVLLNLFFVMVLHMSVDGVALATAAANAVSAVVLLFLLSREQGPCRFSFKKLCLDRVAFKGILQIGLPAGVQGSLFAVSNMLIQSSIVQVNNTLCPPDTSAFAPVVRGNAAAANLEGFAYTAQNSVYQASVTFTSQNLGAAKYERIKRVMLNCYVIGVFIAAFFSGILFLANQPLLALYDVTDSAVGSLEHIAYETAITRMKYLFIPYFTIALLDVGCGIVRGLGKSISSAIICLIGSCLLRVVWISTVFRADPRLEVIYISYPISWTLTAAALFACSILTLRHLIRTRKTEAELHAMHASRKH